MGIEIMTTNLRLRPLEMAEALRLGAPAGDFAVARWLARVPPPSPAGKAKRLRATQMEDGACPRATDGTGEPGLIDFTGSVGAAGWENRFCRQGTHRPRGFAGQGTRAVACRAVDKARVDSPLSNATRGDGAPGCPREEMRLRITAGRMTPCLSLGMKRPHLAVRRAEWEARA